MRIDGYEVNNGHVVAVFISDKKRNMKQHKYEPARPRGEWKNGVCTNCGAECFEDYYMRDIKTEFCHRCGSDMRGESE